MAREEKAKVVDPEATTRTGRFGTGKSDLYGEVRNPNATTRVEKAEARGPLNSSSFNEAPNNTKTISIPEHEAKREGKHMSVLSSGGIDENDVPAEGRYQPKHAAYEPKHLGQEEGEDYANDYAGKHSEKPTTTDFILVPSTPSTPTTSTRRANQEQHKEVEESPTTSQAEAKKEAVSVSEKKGYEPEEGKIDIEEAENPGTEKTENDLEKNNAKETSSETTKLNNKEKLNKEKAISRTIEHAGRAFEHGSGISGTTPNLTGQRDYLDRKYNIEKDKEDSESSADEILEESESRSKDPLGGHIPKVNKEGGGRLRGKNPSQEAIKRNREMNESIFGHNRNYQEEARNEAKRNRNETKGLMG